MATRSQVLFYEEGYDKPIVFYQHWDGYELPHIVADALYLAKKNGRINDTPYLGRIIFSEMLRHCDPEDNTTGYGISFSQTEWCEWTVKIYSSYENDPQIIVENYDGECSYTLDNFINNYLKDNGAFGWVSK
jgi:hypothetical protein